MAHNPIHPACGIFCEWKSVMNQLREYKRKYGHLNILRKYPLLGEFAHRQRIECKKFMEGKPCCTTMDRIFQLKQLGFSFEVDQPRRARRTWDECYAELIKYKKKFGHANVSQYEWELGSWVNLQRSNYSSMKKGKYGGGLTEEQINKLKEVGFLFDAKRLKNRKLNI